MSALPGPFAAALARDFPADFVTTDAGDLATYGRDWTRVVEPVAAAVALPRTTDEVARLLRLCAAHHVAVVPSGGRTGLAGGRASPPAASWSSRSRACAAWIRSTCSAPRCACRRARSPRPCTSTRAEHGLTWPVDFASKGSSQVGGNIATNAGGVKVIRYGLTRHWVLGLQVVLASGEVLELNGALEKNNTGARPAPALHRQRGHPRHRHRGHAQAHPPARRSSTSSSSPCRDLAAVLAPLPRGAPRRPSRSCAYEFFTDALPRPRAPPPQRASPRSRSRRRHYVLLEVERGERRRASKPGSPPLFERGARDRRHARPARARRRRTSGRCARGSARASRRDRPPAQERHRPPHRARWRPSAPSSSAFFVRALPGLGDLRSSATSATATCTST